VESRVKGRIVQRVAKKILAKKEVRVKRKMRLKVRKASIPLSLRVFQTLLSRRISPSDQRLNEEVQKLMLLKRKGILQ
jgi:hypothetical protein